MKAAVCREFGALLTIEDVELSDPGPHEVKIRLSACAICHSDITYLEGGWGGALPAVYGHEAAGIVEQAGEGVTRTSVGDTVVVTLIRSCGECYFCSLDHDSLCEAEYSLDEVSPIRDRNGQLLEHGLRTGAFAEQVVVHESQVVGIPSSIPMDSASLLSCGVITGFGAVTNVARVEPGCTVVTIGTGGVGLNCIQGAAICGSAVNVAVDLAGKKLEAALELGATHGLNPGTDDVHGRILELTLGRGADYVFVAAGSTSALEQALTLVRRAGMVVLVGMTAEGMKAELETLNLANDAVQLVGTKMGRARLDTDIPKLVEHYLAGRLKLDQLVSERYPLDGINDAISAVKQGDALRNVIMFGS